MPVEKTDLERLPPAAEYKVLKRIGQGAFGEVCLINFRIRLQCLSLLCLQSQAYTFTGLKSCASAVGPSASLKTSFQQKASARPCRHHFERISIVAESPASQCCALVGLICSGKCTVSAITSTGTSIGHYGLDQSSVFMPAEHYFGVSTRILLHRSCRCHTVQLAAAIRRCAESSVSASTDRACSLS